MSLVRWERVELGYRADCYALKKNIVATVMEETARTWMWLVTYYPEMALTFRPGMVPEYVAGRVRDRAAALEAADVAIGLFLLR